MKGCGFLLPWAVWSSHPYAPGRPAVQAARTLAFSRPNSSAEMTLGDRCCRAGGIWPAGHPGASQARHSMAGWTIGQWPGGLSGRAAAAAALGPRQLSAPPGHLPPPAHRGHPAGHADLRAMFTAISRQCPATGAPLSAATLARIRATRRAALNAAIPRRADFRQSGQAGRAAPPLCISHNTVTTQLRPVCQKLGGVLARAGHRAGGRPAPDPNHPRKGEDTFRRPEQDRLGGG